MRGHSWRAPYARQRRKTAGSCSGSIRTLRPPQSSTVRTPLTRFSTAATCRRSPPPSILVADRQPDLVYIARERDHDSDRIGEIGRLLHECDHIGVIDGDEAQIGRLLQACVLAPDPVDEAQIRLDIAAAIPVARLDLELVGVAILFAAGQR